MIRMLKLSYTQPDVCRISLIRCWVINTKTYFNRNKRVHDFMTARMCGKL